MAAFENGQKLLIRAQKIIGKGKSSNTGGTTSAKDNGTDVAKKSDTVTGYKYTFTMALKMF